MAIEVGLKSVCSHFFTKEVDQPSESASMKTKTLLSEAFNPSISNQICDVKYTVTEIEK